MNKTSANWQRALRPACWVGAVMMLAGSAHSFAQGTLGPMVVLRTGVGGALISTTQAVGSVGADDPSLLQFAFGFSTDEESAPGVFLDSLTLSLGEAGGSLSVIFNTTDRTGSYWAPSAPGGIFIASDSITRQMTAFPSLQPNHTHQFAYLVTAAVPNELRGRSLNFYADLFDNQNGIDSLGWISVTSVPEPSTWTLAGATLVLFVICKWRIKCGISFR